MSEAEPSVQYGAGQEDPRRSAATQQGSNPDEEQGKEKEDKGKKSGGNDKGGGLGEKRSLEECGWVCACTLALGCFLACFFFNLWMSIKCFQMPDRMGIEGLLVLLSLSVLASLAGGCLVCAAIWYRMRRDLEWCLICCAAATSMGLTIGMYGFCVLCCVPTTFDHSSLRASTVMRQTFDNYDTSFNAQQDQTNAFDKSDLGCCGIIGPGDWSFYHKMDPPPSCCPKDGSCLGDDGNMYNKGCQYVVQDVIFVAKMMSGILAIITLLIVILWLLITIKLIDYMHILTREIQEKLEDDEEDSDDEQEIDVEHLKMD
ncbi:uncharacterized protein LOC142341025 isoform X2 [Convolutriloba macropyga]|uniref:uncharacterized protein LOC142341025 isoform X2 n=1 Tax=Convolutriloba macropyga TaxID=536237 RepID=UPI003F527FCB